jgi:hypothetical protein
MRFCFLRKQKTASGNVSGHSGLRWQAERTGTEKLSATPAMPRKLWPRSIWCLAILSSFAMFSPVVTAAEPIPESSPPPNELASGWTFRVIPYAWLSGLYGSSTVKGRTVGVNLPFDKLLEKTVGKGNLPVALMGDVEARYGPFGIYSDLVWTKVDVSGDRVHVRRFAPEITGAVGTAHDVTIRMGIAEAGPCMKSHASRCPTPTAQAFRLQSI